MSELTAELTVLMGIPASGKSTIVSDMLLGVDYEVVSPDQIRQELTGNRGDQSRNDRVFQLAHGQVLNALGDGLDVLFDATNVTASARNALLEIAGRVSAKTTLIILRTPFEVCLERNAYRTKYIVPESVMFLMHERFVRSLSEIGYEDWNTIINVKE